MGTNGPVTATLVGLDGSPTQSISTFILPGLSTGTIELEANLAALGKGTVTVHVHSLTNSAITASPVAAVTAVAARVTPASAERAWRGDHRRSESHRGVTLRVSRYAYYSCSDLRPGTNSVAAQNAKDYRIIGPNGRIIRIKSAVYNAATNTVTLHPRKRINIHHRYTLIVDGTNVGGLTNPQGQLLDGADSGNPGSNYRTALTWPTSCSTRRLRRHCIGPKLQAGVSK